MEAMQQFSVSRDIYLSRGAGLMYGKRHLWEQVGNEWHYVKELGWEFGLDLSDKDD